MPTHIVFDLNETLFTGNAPYEPYPWTNFLLQTLHAENHLLYLWTMHSRKTTEELLKKYHLFPFFTDLCCGDEMPAKPHAQGLNQLLHDVEKKNILMIGDSVPDMAGARNFDISAIGVLWGEINKKNIKENSQLLLVAGAHYLALNAHECLKYIHDFFGVSHA